MKNEVYCPFCHANRKYTIIKKDVKKFKKTEIDTYENIGICSTCKKELYIPEIEDDNIDRIYGAYIKKNNLISAEDIIMFRKKYNLSQRELTGILNTGKMTINRYEKGELPTKSQSNYIKKIISNYANFIELLNDAFKNERITAKTYKKVLEGSKNKEKDNEESFNEQPNIYNGYKSFEIEKLLNIISYIASKTKLYKTSMNKYLWYIDMLSYKERMIGITGLEYEKMQFGPVIINGEYEDISLIDEKYEREDYENEDGHLVSVIVSKKNYDLSGLEENEKKIIDKVINFLKNKKVSEISELSHKEDAWVKTNIKEKISYEYAEKLKLL